MAKCDNPHCTTVLELGEGVTFTFLYEAATVETTGERVFAEVSLHLCQVCLNNAWQWVNRMVWVDVLKAVEEWDKDHPRPWTPPWGTPGGSSVQR